MVKGLFKHVCISCVSLWLTSPALAINLYGYVEKVRFEPGNSTVKAKLDTGAVSSSLSATHIQIFKINKEAWVSFDIPLDNGTLHLKRKLLKYIRIKPRRSEFKKGFKATAARRPVVRIKLTLGNKTQNIDVNLTNRSAFNYPLLLGRKSLIRFNVAVNPAKAFVSRLSNKPIKER